nr:amino acid permease [Enterococcus timonensis]
MCKKKEVQQIKKEIHFFSAFAIIMGTVIGAGVFFKTATVVNFTHSVGLTLLAWLVGGLLTLTAGLTVAELATMMPETGGAVKYLEKAYGKLAGFLLGWAQSFLYYPANIAALAMIFSTQLINLFQLNDKLLIPISLVTSISITGINLVGTKFTTRVQNVTLLIKLIPILIIVGASFFAPTPSHFSFWPADTHATVNFSGALLATLFAYDGWLGLTAMAGEMKRPEKDFPKAIILGLSSVTVIYLLINWGILKALPLEMIAGNANATSLAATKLLGNIGGKVVTVGLLISVYGALNGYTLSGIRVPYALALENQWPASHFFKKLAKKTQVPYRVALFQLALSCLMLFLGSFDLLTDMAIFIVWIFSLLLFFAVIRLRKSQPEITRPYRVPFYPLVPLVAIAGASFILIMTIITQTNLAFIGIGVTLLGIPVFYLLQRKK